MNNLGPAAGAGQSLERPVTLCHSPIHSVLYKGKLCVGISYKGLPLWYKVVKSGNMWEILYDKYSMLWYVYI